MTRRTATRIRVADSCIEAQARMIGTQTDRIAELEAENSLLRSIVRRLRSDGSALHLFDRTDDEAALFETITTEEST